MASPYEALLGKTVQVVKKSYRNCGVLHTTPNHLVGVQGVVEDVEDLAYESDYPTGHEPAYVKLVGSDEWIDTAFIKEMKCSSPSSAL